MAKQTKVVKAPADQPQPIVIYNIETRPVNRTEQDIPKWRQAIQSAESQSPRRQLLYTLYADVVHDGHVEAVVGKRIDAATTANWQFVDKDGKPVDEINDIIDSAGFDDVVKEIMESKFWGYSIMEPQFWKNHDNKWEVVANLLPRLNYRPELGIISFQAMGEDGINIREGIYAKTIMEVGKTTDLGLLVKASQYAVLKRGGLGDWAMFVQVFGRPIVDATWDGFDEAQRIALQKSLNIGAGGTIVRPEGTNVTLLNGSQGQSNTHGDFYKAMNSEISKALLGTTETTESSSSSGYAQSQTHAEQDDNKHESDISFVRKMLNSRFTKILQAAGFSTEGGSFIIQGDEVRLDKKEAYEIHKSLVNDVNLPINHNFFYEEYGIPKPDNYAQIMKDREAAAQTIQNADPVPLKGKSKKEAPAKPDDVELSLFKKFIRLFQTAPAVTTGATTGDHRMLNLEFEDTLNEAELIKRIFDAKGSLMFDFKTFDFTVTNLLKAFKLGFSKETINLEFAPSSTYDQDDPGLIAAYEQNLFKFAGAKTLAQINQLNSLFKSSKNFQEFYREALQIVGTYNRDWLLTEYNTAILVAQSTAAYHRLKAQTDVFPYWEYKTAGDELVRHSHQLLEGIILPANDTRWNKIYPPNGFNCRCYVSPRLPHEFDPTLLAADQKRTDAYINSPAFEKESRQGWGLNRAELGEVFTEAQQYVHKTPGEANQQLNNLGPENFNLQTSEPNADVPTFDQTVTEWFEALERFKTMPILRDYNKRPLQIDSESFFKTIAKKGDKGQLIAALEDAISKPDEVWLNSAVVDQLVYVKYYKGETLIAIAKVTKGSVELSDWFKLTDVSNYRKGLLVYSKI